MTLHKKLWLAITLLMLVLFSGVFTINSLSLQLYLTQQMQSLNNSKATNLAHSLSIVSANPLALEQSLASEYASGKYELLDLEAADGSLTLTHEDPLSGGTPAWFKSLVSFDVESGTAQVFQDSHPVATLTLRNHPMGAYEAMWMSTLQQAVVFIVAALLAGFMGGYLLKSILRPLEDIVGQAKAIASRRFVTIKAPDVQEFRLVAASMNGLSKRVKNMLQQEANKIEKMRRNIHLDPVSGIDARDVFLQKVTTAFERNDADAHGVLCIVRLSDLPGLNRKLGRKIVDTMLSRIGSSLNALQVQQPGWSCGRLNGSDFAVLALRELEPSHPGRSAHRAINEVVDAFALNGELVLSGACISYRMGDKLSHIMTQLDSALQSVEQSRQSVLEVIQRADEKIIPGRQNLNLWQGIFQRGFSDNQFALASFPVSTFQGEIMHYEAPARLQHEGKTLAAGQFLQWINRLDLAEELDRHVIELALTKIATQNTPTSICLSYAALSNPGFLSWLTGRLSSRAAVASQLWIEVHEETAYSHLEAFKKLATRIRTYGCKIGIEHVGYQLTNIGRLHDVGIDYLKIDETFVRGVDQNPANQTLLSTLGTLGHSLGLTLIAEGVQTQSEWATLQDLGFDGATGPEVTRRSTRVYDSERFITEPA